MDLIKWKEMWLNNYNGKTDAAKDLEGFMKSNYKGHKYIPWATMVKWLFLQDPEAKLDVVLTEKTDSSYPNIVWESKNDLKNMDNSTKLDKDGIPLNIEKFTNTTHKANFVIVECTYFGKTFREVYPVQDTSYNSPAFFDSNMINKSIQRAKAKIISTATGLAFKLYEDGDLQFVDDSEQTKTVPKQNITKEDIKKEVTQPAADIAKDTTNTKYDDAVNDLIKKITSDKETSTITLKFFNNDIMKTYGYTISPDDSDDELNKKIMSLKDPKLFANAFNKRYSTLKDKK